ncbi:hypothetical protein Acr_15g0002350 [Actinidia rufa]|uniref:Uncharacterized protein n=1 Tax=Actinidia rufa TaxID=165716 RepID=A0A7J0FSE0_9ERIC|nr:hypothetical protein Acr_15g0002350 [Actinidia rufa]
MAEICPNLLRQAAQKIKSSLSLSLSRSKKTEICSNLLRQAAQKIKSSLSLTSRSKKIDSESEVLSSGDESGDLVTAVTSGVLRAESVAGLARRLEDGDDGVVPLNAGTEPGGAADLLSESHYSSTVGRHSRESSSIHSPSDLAKSTRPRRKTPPPRRRPPPPAPNPPPPWITPPFSHSSSSLASTTVGTESTTTGTESTPLSLFFLFTSTESTPLTLLPLPSHPHRDLFLPFDALVLITNRATNDLKSWRKLLINPGGSFSNHFSPEVTQALWKHPAHKGLVPRKELLLWCRPVNPSFGPYREDGVCSGFCSSDQLCLQITISIASFDVKGLANVHFGSG